MGENDEFENIVDWEGPCNSQGLRKGNLYIIGFSGRDAEPHKYL
jgi:hypothetical protein